MIEKSAYEIMEKQYGDVASWAIWQAPGDTPKSNTSDMSVFDDPDLTEKLNPNYVFVGLNGSSTHGNWMGDTYRPWLNFHSGYSYQNDYKLRYALMGTKYWGSYITDIIKYYPEVDSGKVWEHLKTNPKVIAENIASFKEEISQLAPHPLLIAMGGAAYNLLKNNLPADFRIVQIKHYSYTIGKEDYRKEVLSILEANDPFKSGFDVPAVGKTYNRNSIIIKGSDGLLDMIDVEKPYSGGITLERGDITKLSVDAIVNAANKSLRGGGGVDGAIHRAAGIELLKECITLNGCETGEAKITKGYKLPAKYVIHTVGPIYHGEKSDAVLLANCYKNSLDLAMKNQIRTIAFPAISTGVYGYPLGEATEIAVHTVCEWFQNHPDYEIRVTFCAFDEYTRKVYENEIRKKFSNIF